MVGLFELQITNIFVSAEGMAYGVGWNGPAGIFLDVWIVGEFLFVLHPLAHGNHKLGNFIAIVGARIAHEWTTIEVQNNERNIFNFRDSLFAQSNACHIGSNIQKPELATTNGTRHGFKNGYEIFTVLALVGIKKYEGKPWDGVTQNFSFGSILDIEIIGGEKKQTRHFVTLTFFV
jgi:hypothetical protein